MLFHCKIAFFLPSVWPGTEYTLALIWIKKLLIYFESYQGISYSHTSRVDRNVITLLYLQVANSANTNCRPFQVNFNCSKFIADELQQRCHMTLLFSLFVTSRNLLFAVFLSRKSIIIFKKNNQKFQTSVTERRTSLNKSSWMFQQNPLKVPVKKLDL